ncbi:MAG: FAD:protein FMN transferase [Oscillospiraceae bacterium]|nr:FAD:protein FMN transferase [Oscillospiraceae bacterium]
MDTYMRLTAYGGGAADGLAAAQSEILRLEKLLSVTLPDSEIFRANGGERVAVSDETADLLSAALALCSRTDGALDITVYPVVKAWGFTTSSYAVPTDAELAELLPLVDYAAVTLSNGELRLPRGVQLDLGAVAKGYAGELAANILRENGVTSALLSLGGNVQAVGAKPDGEPWRVAVRDPERPGEYAGVLAVTDKAVVTSGGYERYFVGDDGETYRHIMNPATGKPAQSGLLSVTVVARGGTLADALSTPLFVMGLDAAIDHWREYRDFEAVFITDAHELYVTAGLEPCFETYGGYADSAVNIIR